MFFILQTPIVRIFLQPYDKFYLTKTPPSLGELLTGQPDSVSPTLAKTCRGDGLYTPAHLAAFLPGHAPIGAWHIFILPTNDGRSMNRNLGYRAILFVFIFVFLHR